MDNIRIVADSTCDLPKDLVEKHQITIIPMYIITPAGEFKDGIDISRKEFYERLPEFDPAPTTAAPGPDVFRQVYEQLAAEGAREILSIHIAHKLSATVNIAHQAASETTVVPVTVLDSRQLSLGTGFQVLTAAQAAAEGRSMSEILSILEDQIKRTHVFAVLDTLEFLKRSGRMSHAVSFIGTLLKIKPFLKMYDGNPVAERVRTTERAMKRLVELLRESAPLEKVALLHSRALERAQELLQVVKDILPEGRILIEEINPALGAHIGPGVVGFACIAKK